jgi:hypothetical protein
MQSYLRAQNNTFRLQKKVILVDLLVGCDILPVREEKKWANIQKMQKDLKGVL